MLQSGGFRPDEVNEFFSIHVILLATVGPGVYSEMSTRRRKIIFMGSRAWPVRRADNLTAICEPTVYTM
jgi:hypothetical protein